MRLRLICFVLLIAGHAFAAEKQSKAYSFRKISGTESPDHHYALAWGFSKADVNWERYAQEDVHYDALEGAEPGDGTPQNYLVDLVEKRVIRPIEGEHFGDKARYNHQTCQAFWSPDSSLLLQLTARKWSYTVCAAYWRDSSGTFQGPFDVGAAATKAALASFQRSGNSARRKWGKGCSLNIDVEEVSTSGLLKLHLYFEDPSKGLSRDVHTCEASMDMQLSRDRAGKWTAKLLKISAEE